MRITGGMVAVVLIAVAALVVGIIVWLDNESVRITDAEQDRPVGEGLKATLNATSWRDTLRYELSRALATGCTLEHLAAVTGFDHDAIEQLRREPRRDFNGRHPTDPHAPGQERFHR